MLNLKKAVKRAAVDVVAVYEIKNILNEGVYTQAFGDNASEVRLFNNTMGVATWVQLISDIKNKRGMKKIVRNQLIGAAIVVAHNACYSTEVRKLTSGFLNK